eukprot:TRINITY_DN14751_c0_g1_i3.p2 TRINITY_DN14751_c0_g1~~TRINITY_DN14751_c0_g1_i3.p2  ORF type:complete len:115 (+),score=4.94 TRINITY_DN14751_c0_g1_i3:578-922(+)
MQIWPDGTKYVGYWRHDKIDGMGRMITGDGDVYTGDWEKNAAHGMGEYEDSSGVKYSGEWVRDRQEGRGKAGYRRRSRGMARWSCLCGRVQGWDEEWKREIYLGCWINLCRFLF